MNAHLLHLEFALIASQALWTGALLFFWLLRHRRVKAGPYRGRRRCKAPIDLGRNAPGHRRAKPDWVRDEIIYLASHLRSCRKVADAFNRRHGLWESVGHTHVWEVIRDHAREIRRLRRERKRRVPITIPVGHTWALDLTFFRSPEGLTFMVIGIIDAGSRKLLYLKVIPRKRVFAIMGHVLLACSEHGLPEVIRTDNEAMFTSRPWLAMLKAMSIRARRGPPLQPLAQRAHRAALGNDQASRRKEGLA
jgi:putative transposase